MEVSTEFLGLIRNSRGHLSDNELREVQEFVEGRDFNLALETLCGFLIDRNREVAYELFVRIHGLSERLDGVDPYLVESVRAIVTGTDLPRPRPTADSGLDRLPHPHRVQRHVDVPDPEV